MSASPLIRLWTAWNKIELTAEQVAQRAGFDEDTIPHIAMAVREAAVNAVLHGNSYDSSKHIVASFETTTDSLIIRIADQGPGLDPDKIPDPLAPENILRGSGPAASFSSGLSWMR